MQILLAFLFGGVIGAAVHALLPHRGTRGVALGPVLAALVGGAVWMLLTWVGDGIADPWLWVLSLAAPVIVTVPALALVTRVRRTHDERERVRLKIA